MPDIHLDIPAELLDSFKAASAVAERTVSAQIRILMREFVVKSAPPAPKPEPLTLAQKAEARDAIVRAKVIAASVARQKAEWVRLLADPRQAHLTEAQMHGMLRDTCNSQQPDIRPLYEAAMREALEEVEAAKAEVDRLRGGGRK